MRIGAVVLAAGLSRRFGGNKLLACVDGKPMIEHVFDRLDEIGEERLTRKCAVVREEELADKARARGIQAIMNDAPELGQAHSIGLGVQAMRDMDAILFLTADQPRLTTDSLLALLDGFKQTKKLACMRDDTHTGNPAVFANAYFDELSALRGDRGAKGVLRAHEGELLVVRCLHDGELMDIDVPQDAY